MKPPIEFRPKRIARVRDSGPVISDARPELELKGRPEIGLERVTPAPCLSEPKTRRQPTPIAHKPEIATGAQDLETLRAKLLSGLPPNEAKQLSQFLDRISHKRIVKAAQMRRYRERQKVK